MRRAMNATKAKSQVAMSTADTANFMLREGQFFIAATLAKAARIPLSNASGNLFNIVHAKKYRTVEKGKPVKVKVISIRGIEHESARYRGLVHQLLHQSWDPQTESNKLFTVTNREAFYRGESIEAVTLYW